MSSEKPKFVVMGQHPCWKCGQVRPNTEYEGHDVCEECFNKIIPVISLAELGPLADELWTVQSWMAKLSDKHKTAALIPEGADNERIIRCNIHDGKYEGYGRSAEELRPILLKLDKLLNQSSRKI